MFNTLIIYQLRSRTKFFKENSTTRVWTSSLLLTYLMHFQSERIVKEKSPAAATTVSAGGESAADLERKISKQGVKVRELKTNKAEKSLVDAEVTFLLDLKKKLRVELAKYSTTAAGSRHLQSVIQERDNQCNK